MPSRRQFLTCSAATAVAAAGGCLSTPTTDNQPSMTDGERLRAQAAKISVERTLSLDADSTYVESNETIRYPARRSGGETTSYGTIPVGEWMRLQAVFVSKDAIERRLDSELSSTQWLNTGATGRGGSETELEVVHTTYEVEGGPDDEPVVSAGRLVELTPKTVDVTVHFEDEAVSGTYPVFVVKWVGTHLGSNSTSEN